MISTDSACFRRCALLASNITRQTIVISIIIWSFIALNNRSTKTCWVIKVCFKWTQTLTVTDLIWRFAISTETRIRLALCTISRTSFTNVGVVWKWPLAELTLYTCTIGRLVHGISRLTCSALTSKIQTDRTIVLAWDTCVITQIVESFAAISKIDTWLYACIIESVWIWTIASVIEWIKRKSWSTLDTITGNALTIWTI